MQIRDGIVEAIGNTPLIKLERASALTGCTILGKAEFMNPGQSVKDRAGRQMILGAEERGELKPGGLVVEATAGNTGIGLAVVANARGYRTIIVIPDTQSQEKKDMLRLCGAELVEVPAVPFSNPNNYQHVGRRLADELRKSEKNGVLFADQWNNLDNRKAHYVSTGPEIWADTRARSTASSVRSAPAERSQAFPLSCAKRKKTLSSASPIRMAPRCTACSRPARWKVGRRLDHRGHRAWPRHSDHRRHQGGQALSHSRRGGRADHLRSARTRRALPRRLNRASMSRERSGSPRISAKARRSSPCSPITATATNPSCSIRTSCARKSFRCRRGLKRNRPSPLPS